MKYNIKYNNIKYIILNILIISLLHLHQIKSIQTFNATTIKFSAKNKCEPSQISFHFKPLYDLTENSTFIITMPGWTNGECNNERGTNILKNNVILSNSTIYKGKWVEGTVSNQFDDSYFIFTIKANNTIYSNTYQKIVIDSINNIKKNCGDNINQNFQYYITSNNSFDYNQIESNSSTIFTNIDTIKGGCYFTNTDIDYFPSNPLERLTITITFISAFRLKSNDNITISMPGITNGPGNGTNGNNIALGNIYHNQSDIFKIGWNEGEYVRNKSGFKNSFLTLVLNDNQKILPGTYISIQLDLNNSFLAQCGMKNDQDDVIFTVNGYYSNVKPLVAEYVDPIGPGCSSLDYCNNHGICDYCLNKCICNDGYGSDNDNYIGGIAIDCSELVCPSGISFYDSLPTTTENAHVLKECSGNGICNRINGQCKCFNNFEGLACDKIKCPSKLKKLECSGHGRCLTMHEIATLDNEFPLSSSTTYGESEPLENENTNTWDAYSLRKCVCDSSWSVGLGANETQLGEWFGPDCSLHRCPSGDDPLTSTDETNCFNITANGNKGVGEIDNKCHVECSNRGLCNYSTGKCNCFKNFWGESCENYDILANN